MSDLPWSSDDYVKDEEFVGYMKMSNRSIDDCGPVILAKEYQRFQGQRKGRVLIEPLIADLSEALDAPDLDADLLWKSGDDATSVDASPQIIPIIIDHLREPRREYQSHYFSILGGILGGGRDKTVKKRLWSELPDHIRKRFNPTPQVSLTREAVMR